MKHVCKTLGLSLLLVFSFSNAQDLGDFKPTDSNYKSSKLKEGSKKLYVANFSINFEIYKEAVDKKAAGGFRRTVKSAAEAKAAIGLITLKKEAIQEKADQLYADFINEMKRKGYEIIHPDVAATTDTYKGWKRATGPSIHEADMTGILSVIPKDYSFFYKERNALSSKMAGFDKTAQNLSQDLDNALIADISLVYIFSETGTDWNIGDQAKVKLLVNYRLANSYTVSDEKTSSGIMSNFDKSKQAVGLSSYVNFTRGKLKIGGSPEAQYSGSTLEIHRIFLRDLAV